VSERRGYILCCQFRSTRPVNNSSPERRGRRSTLTRQIQLSGATAADASACAICWLGLPDALSRHIELLSDSFNEWSVSTDTSSSHGSAGREREGVLAGRTGIIERHLTPLASPPLTPSQHQTPVPLPIPETPPHQPFAARSPAWLRTTDIPRVGRPIASASCRVLRAARSTGRSAPCDVLIRVFLPSSIPARCPTGTSSNLIFGLS
jgi:hypothetical protein